MTNKIISFPTHYEILNYHEGDLRKLEDELSYFDCENFIKLPKYFLDEYNNILFIPRGYNFLLLQEWFNTKIVSSGVCNKPKNVSFKMKYKPKNVLQEECIDFLCGKNKYEYTKNLYQLVLALPTGEGKTFCAVSAICEIGYKSIVIVSSELLQRQWRDRMLEYTNVTESEIVPLNGHKILDEIYTERSSDKIKNAKIYTTTHASLRYYIKQRGYESLNVVFNNLGIGIKIFDEAHLDYTSILKVDYFTNVVKTIYLSATYARSDREDNRIFQKVFSSVYKLAKYNEEKIPYIKCLICYFDSGASYIEEESIKGPKGFNGVKYMDYELNCEIILYKILKILKKIDLKQCGEIIILSAKKISCDTIADLLKEEYPEYKTVSYHSDTKKNVKDLNDYKFVCATSKMLGTGMDFKDVGTIIDLEPTSSRPAIIQKFGRLRERRSPKGLPLTSLYIALFDISISMLDGMIKTTKRTISKQVDKCKEIIEIKL